MRLHPGSAIAARLTVALFALLIGGGVAAPLQAQEITDAPSVLISGVDFSLTAAAGEAGGSWLLVTASGEPLASGTVSSGDEISVAGVAAPDRSDFPLSLRVSGAEVEYAPVIIPGWLSLLPPLIAITLALLFREVVTSLFAGVWLGATVVSGFNPLAGLWRSIDTYLMPAVADSSHASIIMFSLLLGGMVGLISRNGGTNGIVDALVPFASTKRRGKLATWAAGLAIFFDDYANTLVVGNTMRPITDRLKISREKLAYIVDSTAAPVAALVPVSTWVGYEISLIDDGLGIAAGQQMATNPALAASLTDTSPFEIFLHTIPYLFYPLLALIFVFMTSAMRRDLGPMADAEDRAGRGEGLFRAGAQLATDTESQEMQAKPGVTARWWNAGIPVLTVIAVVLGGLYFDGRASAGADASLMDIFGSADPYVTLLWGSLAGCVVAFLLSIAQRILSMEEAIDAWMGGLKAMMIAMVVLTLAWSLGAVTQDLQTAPFLAQVLEGNVPLQLIPVLVFVVSAGMAFATGTSWTTMAIMIPLVVPLTVSLGGGVGFEGGAQYSVLLGAISSVLAGAIFGDHCSPISDTTVLSSTAAGCDHVDHVRTQLPYALLVAVVAMLFGDIGTAYGLPNWIALALGVGVLFGVLKLFGRVTQEPEELEGAAA